MAVAISSTIDTRGFAKAMKTAGPQIGERMRKAFDKIGHDFTRTMSKSRLRGRPGLMRSTGTLARSQRHYVRGSRLSDLRMVYAIGGDMAPYAAIHEFGGEIRPKNGKFLTIPLDTIKTGAGAALSAREFDNTFTIFGGDGGPGVGLIAQRTGDGPDDWRPLFALVKKVTIPPRLGLRSTWRSAFQRSKRERFMREALRQGLRDATKGGPR